jgi:L-threonylcarbamoyladenylate synthase
MASPKAPILESTEANLALAAQCIRDGGVVVAPSDTNMALTLDPWNEAAIERAFRIKNRPPTSALGVA